MPNFSQLIRHSSWTLGSSVFYIALQAIQLLLITHLMSKENFGFLGIANAFCFLAIALLESGVTLSIVQAKEINDQEVSAIMRFNLKLALTLSLILVMLSYPLAYFYGQSEIQTIIWFMIPVIILSAYNVVFVSRLKRELKFRSLSIIEMMSYVIAFITVIFFALNSYDFLSVVFGYWARQVILFFGLFTIKANRLKSIDITGVGKHLEFGKYIYGEKLLTALISNVDALIIGRVFGMGDLGVYDVFKRLIMRPIVLFYNAVENVAFSMLSKLKDDNAAYKKLYSNFTNKMGWLSYGLISIIFLNTGLILSFFPEAYAEYGNVLKAFCLLIASIILANPLDTLMYTHGRTRTFLKWMLIYTLPLIITLVMSAQLSIETIILSHAVFYVVVYLLAYWYMVKKETMLDAKTYFVDSLAPLFVSLIVTGIIQYFFIL